MWLPMFWSTAPFCSRIAVVQQASDAGHGRTTLCSVQALWRRKPAQRAWSDVLNPADLHGVQHIEMPNVASTRSLGCTLGILELLW
jgi:hypothetical protein